VEGVAGTEERSEKAGRPGLGGDGGGETLHSPAGTWGDARGRGGDEVAQDVGERGAWEEGLGSLAGGGGAWAAPPGLVASGQVGGAAWPSCSPLLF